MITFPFHDFDEAHRAENAKRMKEYSSFLVPLTGSPFERVEHLKIPFKENPDFYLYYHLERPPLVYLLMIVSSTIFGNFEWAYRLPSFILGMSVLLGFLIFAKKEGKSDLLGVAIGFLAIITSADLWLSSQYAQLDTGLTLFLFLSLLTLIYNLIFLSGVFFGLALLSKLQPAIIFIFPLGYLFLTKKITLPKLSKFILGASVIFGPWVIYLILRFGIRDVLQTIFGFAITSTSTVDMHQQAPFFWYIRWWWETLRPGWTLFLALVIYETRFQLLDWKKKTLLVYIFGALLTFSIPVNKLWWYVMPLVPAICYYIYLASKEYLKKYPQQFSNLSLVVILSSLPIFLKVSNTLTLIYGALITTLSYLILINRLPFKINLKLAYLFFALSLFIFLMQFPKIIPYSPDTKAVAEFYKNKPYPKCLWLGENMPGEAVLFYSDAGVTPILDQKSQIFVHCKNNYLITPDPYPEGKLEFTSGRINLYQL